MTATFFHRDLARFNEMFQAAGALVSASDGTVWIDRSKVPAGVLSAYRLLLRFGAANGLLPTSPKGKMTTSSPLEDSMTTPTISLTTPEEIRAYWAAGGQLEASVVVTPDRLRHCAKDAHTIALSAAGGLVIVQDVKGGKFRLTNLHGSPLPADANQTSKRRALEMAARIEALRNADGETFDWNAPAVGERSRGWTAEDGQTLREAVGTAVGEQTDANKPIPRPTPPAAVPELTPTDQPFTTVDQVRRHFAAGGDSPVPGTQEQAVRIADEPGMVLVAGNAFVIRPVKLRWNTRRTWTIHHTRTSLVAAPTGSEFTQDEAREFAERLLTLRGESGKPFDWHAPDANERLSQIPDLEAQMLAIRG